MAEEKYVIPANPQYSENIRKLQDSDPADACQIFNPLFSRLIENIASIKRQADGTAAAASSIVTLELAIPTGGWKACAGTDGEPEGLCADLPDKQIREDMVPFLAVLPDCLEIAGACGLNGSVQTLDGFLRVYAKRAPASPMRAVLILALPVIQVGSGSIAGDGEVNEMLDEVLNRKG